MQLKVMCVVAHSDDEVLGCGATLAKHSINGDRLHILYLTSLITSRSGHYKSLASERYKVADYLRASFTVELFPDQELDTIPQLDINRVIESAVASFKPDIIYTHSDADANKDHRIISASVLIAAWNIKTRMFEVPNRRHPPKPFNPNYYEDVEGFMFDKRKLLSFYSSELLPYPDPRSIGGIMVLARYRGLQRMMKYAEAFEEEL